LLLDAPYLPSQAAREGQMVLLNDIHKEAYTRHPYSWISVCSELALPLRKKGGGALGVLDIQSYHPHNFHKDNIPLLQALADQIAIATRNAQLYEREEMRRMLSERLYEIGRALSSTLDRQQVLELILDNLASLLAFDRAAILLYRGQVMEIVAARGFADHVEAVGMQVATHESEEDIFYQIYRSQAPLTIEDVSGHPGWQTVESAPASRSWMGLPLIHRDEVIGMLSLVRLEVRPYTETEVNLATTFAAQAAVALQNARLYQRIARFNQELEQKVQERTEELREAYTRLEQLDRAKSDFIEVASHELRTPITVLRGYSDMLLNDTTIQKNEFHQQLAEGIRSGSIRMHEIVNDMLDVVKIDNENLRLYPAQLSVQDVVRTAVVKLENALVERRQSLQMTGLEELPPIMADPELLHKMLMQLLINAIKYTPDGGQITVSGQTAVDNGVDGVRLTVADSGIGIDPKYHELIFNKFYQTGKVALHSSGKTKFKGGGPGLGLAIARGVVTAHRGRIWAESAGHDEDNCPGSQFHVFLPLANS
jgi:signal transduction histidine kinase